MISSRSLPTDSRLRVFQLHRTGCTTPCRLCTYPHCTFLPASSNSRCILMGVSTVWRTQPASKPTHVALCSCRGSHLRNFHLGFWSIGGLSRAVVGGCRVVSEGGKWVGECECRTTRCRPCPCTKHRPSSTLMAPITSAQRKQRLWPCPSSSSGSASERQ